MTVPLSALSRTALAPTAGIGTRLLNTGLGGLSTIGKILDTPGSVIRGIAGAVATGDPEYLSRALHGVYNPAYRISGTELLGGPKDAFTWGGLATEIILDPVNFVSVGALGAAGQAAKRLDKLRPKAIALESLAKKGAPFAAKKLADTQETINKLRPLTTKGEYRGFAESLRDPHGLGAQRSLFGLEIPFTNMRVDIIKAPEFVAKLADKVTYLGESIAATGVAGRLRKAFINTEVNPVMEALKQEELAGERAGKHAATMAGEDIVRKRILLSAKDPLFDLKMIKLQELGGEELGLTAGPPSAQYMRTLLRTRYNVEELYSKIDNFDETWAFAQELHLLNKQVFAAEKASGSGVTEFDAFGYVARIMTAEGRELLKDNKAAKKILRAYLNDINTGPGSKFLQARSMRDLGIDDLNKKLEAELGKPGLKFFDTDIASIQVNRMMGSSRQINRNYFSQAVVDLFGKATLDKSIGDVPIENIIRGSGPLVENVRYEVPYSAAKYAEFLVKNKEGIVSISRAGAKIGPYEFVDLDPAILKEVGAFRDKRVFTEGGKNARRVWLDSRWDYLVKQNRLYPSQQMLLRTFVGQMRDSTIGKNIDRVDVVPQWFIDEKANKGSEVFGAFHGNTDPTQLRSIELALNPRTNKPYDTAFMVFAHELFHSVHLTGVMGKDFMNDVGRLYQEALAQNTRDGLTEVATQTGFKMASKGIGPKHVSSDAGEWFAEMGARWMLGTRTTDEIIGKNLDKKFKGISDAINVLPLPTLDNIKYGQHVTLYRGIGPHQKKFNGEWWTSNKARAEKYGQVTSVTVSSEFLLKKAARTSSAEDIFFIQGGINKSEYITVPIGKNLDKKFKEISDAFKEWRAVIADSGFFKANVFTGDPGFKLSELYEQTLKTNVEVLDTLPGGSRKRLVTDLMESVNYTRTGYVEIPVDATAGDIRKLFYEKGIDLKSIGKDEAEAFERIMGISQFTASSDTLFGQTLRVMDEVHALYKTALTQYFPAFHARNGFSGVFMNALAGVYNPKYYYRAFQKLRSMDTDEVLYLSNMNVLNEGKTKEVYEFMSQNQGGITSGLKNAFVKPVELIGGEAAGQALRSAGQAAKDWTRHVGYTIENHSRLTHYLAMKDRGLSDSEAADSVIKYFFDYSDLTDFEKAVPRRAMLFYTFFRKNLPLMMESTFTNPKFMLAYARATGQTNINIPRPEWLPEGFQLSEDEKGNQILLNFGLPPEDLRRFDPHGNGLARVFEVAIASMAPVIKEPYQFISGRNAFLGRPMEGGIGERLAAALPTSRITATGGSITRAIGGEAGTSIGKELLRVSTGINPRSINKETQKVMVDLERTRAKLRELVRSGGARKIEIVGERKGLPNPDVGALNSQASKLQDRLRKLDVKRVQPAGSTGRP